MRGETLCFSVEPIVRDGKVTHNFSFKVAITEINPAEFLPARPYLYDITLLPVYPFEKPFKKVQGEIKFEYTTDGLARVLCKTKEFILQNITFEKSYLLIELCKVKLKYLYKSGGEIGTVFLENPEIGGEIGTFFLENPEIGGEIGTFFLENPSSIVFISLISHSRELVYLVLLHRRSSTDCKLLYIPSTASSPPGRRSS
jgi:hypothetical protein